MTLHTTSLASPPVKTFARVPPAKTAISIFYDIFLVTENTTMLARSIRTTAIKVSEERWLQELEKAYNDANVPQPLRYAVPTGCLGGQGFVVEPCPTEEDWCRIDPECSKSIYQEPNATIKAGPIAGIVVAFFVVLLVLLYLAHRWYVRQQAQRYRRIFAARVAETIHVRASVKEYSVYCVYLVPDWAHFCRQTIGKVSSLRAFGRRRDYCT